MNLLEVGALLKRERERRGISIRDVMDATKISRRNLTAIEEGQVQHLPHPVYLKGYVRNIARMVGLDADELANIVDLQFDEEQSEYYAQDGSAPAPVDRPEQAPRPGDPVPAAQQHQTAPERDARKPHAPEPLVPNKPKAGGALRPALVLVLLVAVLVGLLVQYQRMPEKTTPEPAPAAQPADSINASRVADASALGGPDGLTSPANASETLTPGPASTGVGAGARVEEPAHPAVQPLPAPGFPAPAAPAPGVPAKAPTSVPAASIEVSRAAPVAEVRTPGMQQLTITAKENEVCWIEVNDGKQSRSFTLQNGESRQVEFASRMRVRLGNAGGVSFRLNGQEHSYEGKRGSIDTVEFGTR